MTTAVTTSTHVYRVYIKASAEKIWQAITDPEWTNRYGYTGYAQYDLRPGGDFRIVPSPEFKAASEANGYPCPDVMVDGQVIEADPPHKLVSTWRMAMSPEAASEGFTTLTYEIKDHGSSCSVTVTHELEGKPLHAAMVSGGDANLDEGGGGWPWVLSDLKSLLETGATLAG